MESIGKKAVPPSVLIELKKLGGDIRKARIRRKLRIKDMAGRAFVSANTIASIEKGSPTVAIGIYARVLALLGIRGLGMLADISRDPISQDIEDEDFPKRVRV